MVEFPAPQDAAAFYTTSIDTWAACTGTYTYTPTGAVWNVGESGEAAGTLIASTSQQGANWLCSRALTAAANLVVDVLTCSSDALSRHDRPHRGRRDRRPRIHPVITR